MKLIMMAAALMLGSAAVAQTTEETAEDATTTTTTTTTTTATTMPAGRTVAPGNTAPERDARGIPVVSAPATAPAGYNQGAQMLPAGTPMPTMARPTPTAAGDLPPCSRTVTDRCTQTYERGRAR
jgi:hypothetical protein